MRALVIPDLDPIPEQRHLARHQPQPRPGLPADECEGATGPVVRHLARRQRPAFGSFRETHRILAFAPPAPPPSVSGAYIPFATGLLPMKRFVPSW